MKLIILESPFSGDIPRNTKYARKALRDSLMKGESPIASHLLYTQEEVLDDSKEEERKLGIDAGYAWFAGADLVAVYADLGVSPGMLLGIERAGNAGIKIEFRYISPEAEPAQKPSEEERKAAEELVKKLPPNGGGMSLKDALTGQRG